jgi:hypothetical protein
LIFSLRHLDIAINKALNYFELVPIMPPEMNTLIHSIGYFFSIVTPLVIKEFYLCSQREKRKKVFIVLIMLGY